MPNPKWVISMGACASCGGIFNNYAIKQGVDRVVPVDIYVPGCPPRPEQLIDGILMLYKKIEKESVKRPQITQPNAQTQDERPGEVSGQPHRNPSGELNK